MIHMLNADVVATQGCLSCRRFTGANLIRVCSSPTGASYTFTNRQRSTSDGDGGVYDGLSFSVLFCGVKTNLLVRAAKIRATRRAIGVLQGLGVVPRMPFVWKLSLSAL